VPQQYNNVQNNTYPEVYPQPPNNRANVQSNAYPEVYQQTHNAAYSGYAGYQPQPQPQTHMFVPKNTPVDTQVFCYDGTLILGQVSCVRISDLNCTLPCCCPFWSSMEYLILIKCKIMLCDF
jgi:hypothetical protein